MRRRNGWSSVKRFAIIWIVLFLPAPTALAESIDDDLINFAVNVHQTPLQTWGPGYGIYLGDGLFITAAHVAGRSWFTRPKVSIEGREYPTQVVKEGSFDGTDLTLLSVEEHLLPMRLALRHNKLCVATPVPGQKVITVVPERIAKSQIFPPEKLPPNVRKYSTVIADVSGTGDSGSGVFDPERKCLLGIMSRKITQILTYRNTGKTETHDIAKYFVPASNIREFIPPGTSF